MRKSKKIFSHLFPEINFNFQQNKTSFEFKLIFLIITFYFILF